MAPGDVRTYYSAISYPEQSPTLQSRIRTLSKAPSRPHFCGFCYIGVSNLHLRRPSEHHPLSGPGIFSSVAKCMESTRVPLRIMVSVDLIRSSGNEKCDTTTVTISVINLSHYVRKRWTRTILRLFELDSLTTPKPGWPSIKLRN